MIVSLDLHDFSILNNRLDLLMAIKEHYPDFKVSMFTVPFDVKSESRVQRMYHDQLAEQIRQNLDWIQIIPHGLTHMGPPHSRPEFENVDYYEMRDLIIPAIDEAFKKDGLPYEKGFCAPYWVWTEGVVKALDEAGWWGAADRNQPDMLRTKKVYTYTHSLEEPFWLSTNEVLNLHGHIDGVSKNDLEATLLNILKLPADVEWKFVTDFIKDTV